MNQRDVISWIVEALQTNEYLDALYLAGSFARNSADEFSDIDLVAVVEPEHQAAFETRWQRQLEALVPVVFWQRRLSNGVLLNAVTDEWLRCDMFIVSRAEARRRSQSSLQVLLDPQGIFATLPLQSPPYAINPVWFASLVEQFIRIVGLLPVGIGRQEFHGGVTGAALLRGLLIELFLEELELLDVGGAQQLNRVLTDDQKDALERLPLPPPNREPIVAFFLACAKVFIPRARKLAARHGIAFPDTFATAARERLKRSLGLDDADLWSRHLA